MRSTLESFLAVSWSLALSVAGCGVGAPAKEAATTQGSHAAAATTRELHPDATTGPPLRADLASRYDEAQAFLRQGRKTRALKLLREIASAAPDNLEVRFFMGIALRGRGLRDRAREDFDDLAREHPESPLGPTGLALLAIDDGRTQEARRQLARARASGHGSAWLALAEGKTLQMEGQDEAALERFRHASSEDPALAEAWTRQGMVLAAHGRFDEAEAAIRRALEASPNDLAALSQLALTLQRLGREEEARAVRDLHRRLVLVADLSLAPPGTSVRARRKLAAHFERSGKLREALAEYEALLGLEPNDDAVRARAAKIRTILQAREGH